MNIISKPNIFSCEKINTGRQFEIDFIRGFSVLFMVFNHITESFSHEEIQNLVFFKNLTRGIGDVAVLFMFVLGIGIVYSQNQNSKYLIKRGVCFLIFGYCFNFLRFCLPVIMLKFFNQTVIEYSPPWDMSGFFFQIDIFQFAGLAFIFIAILRIMKIPIKFYILIAFLGIIINYYFTGIKNGQFYILDEAILKLFFGKGENTYFPFFTWISFPLIGVVFGKILQHVKDKEAFYRLLFRISFLAVILGIFIQMFLYPYVDFFGWENEFSYYNMGSSGIIFFIFYDFLLFSISFFILRLNIISYKSILNEIMFWSVNITSLYIVSWILIAWGSLFIFRGLCKIENISTMFLLLAFIPLGTRLIVSFYKHKFN